jgi:hypothetical protein
MDSQDSFPAVDTCIGPIHATAEKNERISLPPVLED